jgi:hypothetical protein
LPISSANEGSALSRASASRIVFTASSLRRRRLVVASRHLLPLSSPSTASTWSRRDLSSRRRRLVVASRHLHPLLSPSTASASSRHSRRLRLVIASRGFSPSYLPPLPPPRHDMTCRRAVVGWLSYSPSYLPPPPPPRHAVTCCRAVFGWLSRRAASPPLISLHRLRLVTPFAPSSVGCRVARLPPLSSPATASPRHDLSLRRRRLVVASRGFSPSYLPSPPLPRHAMTSRCAVIGWLSHSPSNLPPPPPPGHVVTCRRAVFGWLSRRVIYSPS